MKKINHIMLIAALFIILLTAALFTAPAKARAMCIYNHTTYPLKAILELFDANWIIGPTQKKCTNGTGYYTVVYLLDPFRKTGISTDKNMHVEDHGWVSVYKKEDGKWKVVNKRKNGSVKSTQYLRPLPVIDLKTPDGQPLAR